MTHGAKREYRPLLVFMTWALGNTAFADETPVIEVFQTVTCECCKPWVKHLEAAGFTVKVTAFDDPMAVQAVKRELGVPVDLGACHTAKVDSYVVEGHVSADEIRRLLKERPAIKGLVVPRMPKGAPGIESNEPQRYEVLALDASGGTTVFAVHEPSPANEPPVTKPE